MTSVQLFMLTGVVLFGVGLWGMATVPDLIRKVIALNIMSIGIFCTLVTIAYREYPQTPDPVPHAMVLTGIVVSVSATALALAIIRTLGGEEGATIEQLDAAVQGEHNG